MVYSAHGARRIAFFGGSFDPPHRGHLAVARAAQLALDLDTVLFAPVGSQPLKPHGASAGFEDRLAMTELAIKSKPNFAISLADAPAPGAAHNYTIDTLLRLRAELPDNSVLFCLLGADSFLALQHWRRGADIPFAAPLIVASRPGQQLEDLAAALPPGISINAVPVSNSSNGIEVRTFALRNPAGAATPFYLLPGLEIEVSASEIRSQAQAAHGRLGTGHDLLPESVSDYIAAHGLYR
jgi:nicotinate-nucleotide adenylyltransferase